MTRRAKRPPTDQTILAALPALIESGGNPRPCDDGRFCLSCLCLIIGDRLDAEMVAVVQARNVVRLMADTKTPTKEQALAAARAALEFVA